MLLLAAGIEIFQFLFANRQLSFFDFLAGALGVFIYLTVLKLMRVIYKVAGGAVL